MVAQNSFSELIKSALSCLYKACGGFLFRRAKSEHFRSPQAFGYI